MYFLSAADISCFFIVCSILTTIFKPSYSFPVNGRYQITQKKWKHQTTSNFATVSSDLVTQIQTSYDNCSSVISRHLKIYKTSACNVYKPSSSKHTNKQKKVLELFATDYIYGSFASNQTKIET